MKTFLFVIVNHMNKIHYLHNEVIKAKTKAEAYKNCQNEIDRKYAETIKNISLMSISFCHSKPTIINIIELEAE